jgi:hypothetical protein
MWKLGIMALLQDVSGEREENHVQFKSGESAIGLEIEQWSTEFEAHILTITSCLSVDCDYVDWINCFRMCSSGGVLR